MNRRMVLSMVGQIIKLEGILMIIPAVVSLCYKESCFWPFLITIAIALIIGFSLTIGFKPSNKVIFAKEGFVIVALAWIFLSAIAALPFVIDGAIPSFIDAFFETASGFSTTGASILTDVTSLSHGLLFWRSFTHWIGGMGVLVLIVALLPSDSGRTIHILRAEMPGPIMGKIVPKMKDTAKILYLIYMGMTVLETILLLLGGMPLFDSLVHTFGTAGTGGFGIKGDSIGSYSPYLQWVITIFMLLFGVNFNLYYMILIRRIRSALKSSELRCYFVIVTACIAITTFNILPLYSNFSDALRASAFQVSSIMTTTGYSTADYTTWPLLSKTILFSLMFIGGCAGSTAGGLKLSRVIMLFKMIRAEISKMLHPHSVNVVRFEGKTVETATLSSLGVYFMIYFVLFFSATLLLSFEPFDLETNISAVTACINNIGPGFGEVGPMYNFASYSGFSKLVLAFLMLFGRLEIYPMLFLFFPSTWTKK